MGGAHDVRAREHYKVSRLYGFRNPRAPLKSKIVMSWWFSLNEKLSGKAFDKLLDIHQIHQNLPSYFCTMQNRVSNEYYVLSIKVY